MRTGADSDNLARQIQEIQKRVAQLQQQASESGLQQELEIIAAVFEDLLCLNQALSTTHQAVEAEHQRYQELFEFAPDAYLVTDRKGIIQEANRAAARMLNIKQQFLAGKSLDIYIVHSEKSTFYFELNQLQQGGGVREWELCLQPPEREFVNVTVKVAARCNQDGKLVYLYWLLRDITEPRQVLSYIRGSVGEIRQIFDMLPSFVWKFCPATTQFIYASEIMTELSGIEREVFFQNYQIWDERVDSGYESQEAIRIAWEAISKGEPYQVVYLFHTLHKGARWFEVTARPALEDGVLYYYGCTTDITDRKQAEEDIREALEREKELSLLKSRFVSMTSHEFRIPLATILFSAGLLEKYGSKWSEAKKQIHLQRIQTAVKRMNEMVEDVLLIGKTDASKLECRPAPLDIKAFCKALIAEVQLIAGERHGLTFVSHGECAGSDGVLPLLDEKLLRHILTNLLSNAIKYSPRGGTILCELICGHEEVTFRIKDEGIGIPQEEQKQLFEIFQRATNVGNIPGTGLGLAIAKKFVELHGGEITVDSQMGLGTTFTVKLPWQPRC